MSKSNLDTIKVEVEITAEYVDRIYALEYVEKALTDLGRNSKAPVKFTVKPTGERVPYNHKLDTCSWEAFKKVVESAGISNGDEFTSILVKGDNDLTIFKELLADEETFLFDVSN